MIYSKELFLLNWWAFICLLLQFFLHLGKHLCFGEVVISSVDQVTFLQLWSRKMYIITSDEQIKSLYKKCNDRGTIYCNFSDFCLSTFENCRTYFHDGVPFHRWINPSVKNILWNLYFSIQFRCNYYQNPQKRI